MRKLPTRHRVCSVCARGEILTAELARARAEGLSYLALARRFSLSKAAVFRHCRNGHYPRPYVYNAWKELAQWERSRRR